MPARWSTYIDQERGSAVAGLVKVDEKIMAGRWKYVDGNADRELWLVEIDDPSGQSAAYYQGTMFIQVERGRLKAPVAPIFKTRAEGLAWLNGDD